MRATCPILIQDSCIFEINHRNLFRCQPRRTLTTFSAFSSELVTHLQEGRPLWAGCAAAVHLGGSVLMTFAGIGHRRMVQELG
jgi:hypothetical protein